MSNRSVAILADGQESSNERLRQAMVTANLTVEGLARQAGINPQSVYRWISLSRVPYARNAHAVARRLHVDPYLLWPSMDDRHRSRVSPRDEILACYPSRGAVPYELWRTTLLEANGVIDLAIANLLFLADVVSDLNIVLAKQVEAGVRVRLAVPAARSGQIATLADVFPSLPRVQV